MREREARQLARKYGMEQITADDAFYRIYVSIQNRKDEAEINAKRKEIYIDFEKE